MVKIIGSLAVLFLVLGLTTSQASAQMATEVPVGPCFPDERAYSLVIVDQQINTFMARGIDASVEAPNPVQRQIASRIYHFGSLPDSDPCPPGSICLYFVYSEPAKFAESQPNPPPGERNLWTRIRFFSQGFLGIPDIFGQPWNGCLIFEDEQNIIVEPGDFGPLIYSGSVMPQAYDLNFPPGLAWLDTVRNPQDYPTFGAQELTDPEWACKRSQVNTAGSNGKRIAYKVFQGESSLRIKMKDAEGVGGVRCFHPFAVNPGDQVDIDSWVYAQLLDNAVCRLIVQFYDADRNLIADQKAKLTTTGSWSNIGFNNFMAPAGTEYGEVSLQTRSKPGFSQGKCYFDDIGINID